MSAAQSSSSAAANSPRRKRAKTMSIGVVLEQLRQQFPDVTVSKIRFLESEGLVSPQRTASGYRRFTEDDVDRLRYILTTQRDNYTPLKVIREQLEAMDSGQVTAIVGAGRAKPWVEPARFRAPVTTRLTDADVADKADSNIETVAALTKLGLLQADQSGFFTTDDVAIVSTVEALKGFGLTEQHLKSLRNNARRQADLISQVAAPVANSKSDLAAQQAEEISSQMTALVVSLHATLVKNTLRGEF
ncbi:MerR family transcriptional regulator [Corynebacterium massiliense]|uniref:transcriptional regulator FtsR n=1 Tax=Corynebacterium massiliense TaxID=441501 RepID=UPI0023556A8C|nr:MerR family transcriptional regulator [Corynebacterium massiliense]